MTYTLGQAAKATGKSKPTISRAIKKGIISATKNRLGQYSIDPSELHSVYPPLPSASNDTGTTQQSETLNSDKVLQKEIEYLHKMLDQANERVIKAEERESDWQKQAERVTALIEDHSQRRGFWARLTGK